MAVETFESEVGAPGMTAWQCLVAVALRQATNSTYDDLEVHFNQNQLLREFCEIPKLDHSSFSESRLVLQRHFATNFIQPQFSF